MAILMDQGQSFNDAREATKPPPKPQAVSAVVKPE
jgi:hypothetical protein